MLEREYVWFLEREIYSEEEFSLFSCIANPDKG